MTVETKWSARAFVDQDRQPWAASFTRRPAAETRRLPIMSGRRSSNGMVSRWPFGYRHASGAKFTPRTDCGTLEACSEQRCLPMPVVMVMVLRGGFRAGT